MVSTICIFYESPAFANVLIILQYAPLYKKNNKLIALFGVIRLCRYKQR